MPKKINEYRSHGEKIISLFAKLLFSQESYSLTQLSKMLSCSKATILRLIEIIKLGYGVTIDETMKGNKKYFNIKKPYTSPSVTISEMEIQVLHMCKAFAENLLGHKQFEEAARALMKSKTLLPDKNKSLQNHFATFRAGRIDYTPHQNTIKTIIEAMDKKLICKISYQKIMAKNAKISYIKPLKIFSHHDTVYLHARYVKAPGSKNKEPIYDPVLAIHRFKSVEITEQSFAFPDDYDFEKVFNNTFGIIAGESFQVEVEFTGKPAEYVSERIWSENQKIIDLGDGKIRLIFKSSSKVELIPWVLAFAGDIKVIKPDWLVNEIKSSAQLIMKNYE